MSITQSIGWCDETINPIRGCTAGCWADAKHPEGNCYAAEIARRRMADCERCHDHLDVHLHEERLEAPPRWKKARRIFLGSMTDLWDPNVKPEWRQAIWRVCVDTKRHTYIALTKQPQNIYWGNLVNLENLIVGTSVSCGEDAWRVAALRIGLQRHNRRRPNCQFPGRIAVSFEPLIGDVHDLERCSSSRAKLPEHLRQGEVDLEGIDWVIIGAASGAVARIHPPRRETLAPIIDGILTLTDRRGLPVFLKENAVPYLPERIGKRELQERYQRYPERA